MRLVRPWAQDNEVVCRQGYEVLDTVVMTLVVVVVKT